MANKNQNHKCDFCGKNKEEVEKLIVSEFSAICNDCVDLCVGILNDEKVKKFPKENKTINPTVIKDFLDEYIVGQDETKIVLSVAVSQHFKRIHNQTTDIVLEKSNVLMLGPTGCGKTLLVKKIAEFLDIPFAICDATGLTEAGYVGEDVDSILMRLVAAADGDIDKAKHGIIYIDEIDKIARKGEGSTLSRDVSGEGVQQSLLKMIEGSKIRLTMANKRKNSPGEQVELDTDHILFICGGAFVGLEKIIQQRSNQNSMGFGANISNSENLNFYESTQPKDLIQFGFIPEFIGRFGIITTVNDLTLNDLISILRDPKNSLIKQYQYIFKIDGIDLTFEDSALMEIARLAKELKTNARGLRNILEKVLLPYQFGALDLVERGLIKLVISKDTIAGNPAVMIFDKKIKHEQNQNKK